jgi:hypothetical protein
MEYRSAKEAASPVSVTTAEGGVPLLLSNIFEPHTTARA